jgi:hypothetical protein
MLSLEDCRPLSAVGAMGRVCRLLSLEGFKVSTSFHFSQKLKAGVSLPNQGKQGGNQGPSLRKEGKQGGNQARRGSKGGNQASRPESLSRKPFRF